MTEVRNCEVWIPPSPKTGDGRSTHSGIPSVPLHSPPQPPASATPQTISTIASNSSCTITTSNYHSAGGCGFNSQLNQTNEKCILALPPDKDGRNSTASIYRSGSLGNPNIDGSNPVRVIGGVMVTILVWNACDVGSIPTLRKIFSIFITPTTPVS